MSAMSASFSVPGDLQGIFTAAEVQKYKDAFVSYDRDQTATITRDQLTDVLRDLGKKVSEIAISMILGHKADAGIKVTFGEYLTVLHKGADAGEAGKAAEAAAAAAAGARSPNGRATASRKSLDATEGRTGGLRRTGSKKGGAYHSYSDDEKRAFSEHINNCLARDPHIAGRLPLNLDTEDLFEATKDGLLLCKLINLAEFDTVDVRALNVPTPAKPELSIFHKVENMNLALNAARGIGCVVTNVNAKDIIDGNEILMLGLIWQIIRIQLLSSISLTACPELVALLGEEEELDDLLNLQPEVLLIRWFNHHLEASGSKKRINNFGKDLQDGEALSVLLHQLDPVSCDLCNEPDPLDRAAHIIYNAKSLGVETFIQPADITKANKKLLMAFVAQIFNTNPALEVDQAALDEIVANFASIDIDDAGDSREEKVFRMWINSLGVDGGNLYLNSLFHDVQDGVAILKVMDHIQPGSVVWKRVNDPPKNRYKKVENGNYVIEIAKQMGLTVVNVGGLDIIDGNKKMTLAIIWQLMRRHTLNLLQDLSETGRRIEDPEVVRWANKKVPTMRIKSFGDSSLGTGVFLLKVCHGVARGVVNWELVVDPPVSKEDRINNAKYAISVARKLGALVFCVPEDIVEVRSRMIMLFCASLWNAEKDLIAAKQAADAEAAAAAAREALEQAERPQELGDDEGDGSSNLAETLGDMNLGDGGDDNDDGEILAAS